MKYRVLIKGTEQDARESCTKHGLRLDEAKTVQQTTGSIETVGIVTGTPARIIDLFTDPTKTMVTRGEGFPPGTLLFFSPILNERRPV